MSYTAWSVVAGEQPTAAKWNQLGTNDAGFNDGTNIVSGSFGQAHFATGVPVQVQTFLSATMATGTTLIPRDNTIPQNTEGDQYMSLTITPKSATNLLVIQATVFVSSSVLNNMIAVLFQDSTANALAAGEVDPYAATAIVAIPLIFSMVAGTTSATTFKIRAGGSLAGTTTFNGTGAAQLYSTASKSSMVITEYKA